MGLNPRMAGANIRQIANDIYAAIRHDPALIAAKRAEFAAAASAITGSSGGFTITSSTVNGQSFAGTSSLSSTEKLAVLRMVMQAVDTGRAIPTSTRAAFL